MIDAGRRMRRKVFFCLLVVTLTVPGPLRSAGAEVMDRVVAFVDDHAITLSEFREQFDRASTLRADMRASEVLDTMVNRILLLREAKKYRIEAPTDEEIMKEYIDLKVRAFIRIGESEMEDFFVRHEKEFAGKEFEDVREEIERFLAEQDLNERLKDVVAELRRRAYIKTQLAAP